ncbi:MAG: ubiquinol-cytochrome c reductase iron-sulfur subunit [Anaerolineales bacterium]|nr:ubiquinol-cytochrome c reductase iron-sulfur subunit [Anaerolineales bacterium]
MGDKQASGDSRRQFLKTATAAIGAVIAAGFGFPAVAYLIGPALKRDQTEAWIPLGPTSKVEPGTPTLFRVTVERQTGWITATEELSVYALTENGRDYTAMSNICTHLGCRVRWIDGRQEFFCPCHNGVFDKQGAVVSGPPPRPLDRYPTKVEDGQIYILGGVDHG